jgi:hypothetical protein
MSKTSRRASRRNRAPREERLKGSSLPHGKPKGGQVRQRLPMNMQEVRDLLSTVKPTPHLRHPTSRSEYRYWDKLWQYKGRAMTKPEYKGDSKKRKQRQEKQSKSWRKKRESNNKRREA